MLTTYIISDLLISNNIVKYSIRHFYTFTRRDITLRLHYPLKFFIVHISISIFDIIHIFSVSSLIYISRVKSVFLYDILSIVSAINLLQLTSDIYRYIDIYHTIQQDTMNDFIISHNSPLLSNYLITYN